MTKPKKRESAAGFRPIEKTTIPGEIVDQILSMLLTGKLEAGDRLPPERRLCESLNVGRSSVREALKALEVLGIIRRDIKGTTVCAPEENRFSGLSLTAGNASLEQIFESARAVGIEAAGLAAKRATPRHLKKMVSAMRESEDKQQAAAIHLSFHRAMVDAAQNPVMSQIYNMLVALISRSRRLALAVQGMNEDEGKAFIRNIFSGHGKILEAIESNNSAAAKRAMREHFKCMEDMALREMSRHGNKAGRRAESSGGVNRR